MTTPAPTPAYDSKVALSIQSLLDMPEADLEKISFTLPSIILGGSNTDADGFSTSIGSDKEISSLSRQFLQQECWNKFHQNPQVNTAVRGQVGRICGMGFEATSGNVQIQDAIEEIELDWRNRLYSNWRQYVARAKIEGELFLPLTCHEDGFIEVDFLDPCCLGDTGDDDTGIIFHPKKSMMPLFYNVSAAGSKTVIEQVPSIFLAFDPSLEDSVKKHDDYNRDLQPRSNKSKFKALGGFTRFIVAWEQGFVTRRAISHLRTVLEWLNHYENLKKYEIDHKKASGAYVWTVTFDDVKAFRLWMGLSEEDRKKTALMAPVMPGSRLFVPPGLNIKAESPNLPSLSNQDTDIMQMMTSGLNEASDVTTGSVGGTYASVKATRGPMSDRTSDEVAYFDRFYRFDFWGAIFWLKHKLINFPAFFMVDEAIGFDKNREPIMGKRKKLPAQLIEVAYPVSETSETESMTKALLGSKHGPLTESVGVPPSYISKRLGIHGCARNRLRKATEDKLYPALVYSIDADKADADQETAEGEQPKDKNVDPEKKKSAATVPAVKKPDKNKKK